MKGLILRATGTIALTFIAFGAAQAAIITQMGQDVEFTYDDSTLYGTGTVVGNSIFFSPTSFKAESLNADGLVQTTEMLDITVDVKAGSLGTFVMTEFQLVELGDYQLAGSSSTVSQSGDLTVTSNTKTCGGPSCSDMTMFNAGPLTTVGALTEWTASAGIDFSDTVGWGNDTSVLAEIDNMLEAASSVGGESAMIQKKAQGVGLVINPIPVPAAVWLFGSALGLLGWCGRRGRQA
ncbi:MAG: hypothetical protein KJO13_07080 [Gammaproteobacteria bacterium]|nr:hypothetical protein [Gammaproteobacteria bacterium]